MKNKILSAFVFSTIVLGSCSPKVAGSGRTADTKEAAPMQTSNEIKVADAGPAKIAEGKALFENSCGRCHSLYAPADYTREQWKPIVDHMAPKARLDKQQAELIYQYVAANAKQ